MSNLIFNAKLVKSGFENAKWQQWWPVTVVFLLVLLYVDACAMLPSLPLYSLLLFLPRHSGIRLVTGIWNGWLGWVDSRGTNARASRWRFASL